MADQRESIGVIGQTVLLFKKNFLSKIRQEPKKLIGEIVVPILYLCLLCFLIKLQNIETYEKNTESGKSQDILLSLSGPSPIIVHIVPNLAEVKNFTSLMNTILKRKNSQYQLSTNLEFIFHTTETSLLDAYQSGNVDMAIVFETTGGNVVFNNYTIKINPDGGLPAVTTTKVGLETCRNPSKEFLEYPATCPVNGYYYTNFLALQSLVDQAFLELKSTEVKFSIKIQNYPVAEYIAGLPIFLRILIPLYSVIPLSQLINNLLVLIVTEKEAKIKDGLRMVGVSDMAYWMSWFGVYSIIILIFSLMFTIVMYFMKVLSNLNPLILFLIFLLFGFSVITFAFALTPFFHKPKTAGIVGTLVLQITSLLFMLQTFVVGSSKAVLIPMRLISSLAFTTALDQAAEFEYMGGIGWSDLVIGGRGEGILYSLIFLVFGIFFYGIIAVYLDNVLPNQFGVRKHPLYCFMPNFWFGKAKQDRYEDGKLMHDFNVPESENWIEEGDDIEPISPNLVGKEAIRIRHIKKTYYPSWTERKATAVEAVKDISLNIYEGQITAILGRNGAGKSTLFNMLIGLVAPTSGGSNVFGYDISDPYDMAKVRKLTGVCLQSDLHFIALTVEEHLQFYGELRGLNKSELKSEINTILTDLKLKDKRNTRAAKLSGGQKRKLSIGIALIGDPKIILLDEPTAGVDPVSRRHLWDLLQRKKTGKVILLTTHFMDEADILADRKVIIHDGVTKCIGSSFFLKNRFGVGYYLTIELKDKNVSTTGCDELIKKWIPSALESKKVVSTEVKYSLPHTEVSHFVSLFAALEDTQEINSAGIKSYGVSMTTLEEVFLKISTNVELLANSSENPIELDGNYGASDEQNLIGDFGTIVIKSSAVFWSMCKLRILRLIRSPQAVFFMLFMPVILAAIGLYLVKISTRKIYDANLVLSDTKGIYSNSELHVALLSDPDDGNLKAFLMNLGLFIHNFTGEFSSLLDINQPDGTMAGIIIKNETNVFDINLMINGTYVHSTPLIMSAIQQYFQSYLSKQSNLVLTSRPFVSKSAALFDVSSFYVIFLLGPAFVFTSVGMVIEIVYDREIKARNHLRVNGLTFRMYFSSIFLVFGLLAVLVTLMQLSLIAIFSVDAFLNPYAFVVTAGLLLLYIPPSLFFSASFSYLFDRMESAQSVFSQVASWSGTIVGLIIVTFDASKVEESVVILIHSVFCVVDIFYIPFGIFYFVNKQYFKCSILGTCDELNFSNYTGSEFTVMLVALLVQIPVFLFLLIIVDVLKDGGSVKDSLQSLFRFRRVGFANLDVPESISSSTNVLNPTAVTMLDEDVEKETVRVKNYFSLTNTSTTCVLAVKNIVKHYPVEVGQGTKKKKLIKNVVNKLNLMVDEGEVFGLLGHNGAGKTTAMKLITAEESPNEGNVKLCGFDIKSNISEAFVHLGYCPQHDVLWENITLREHLEIYSSIRGILPTNRDRLVDHFLFGLKIKEHAEKKAVNLSGGTKRKLSYALSMLGAPKVVLLDEPSTGMDPQSKRFLWNTILGTFKESRGAMLTTHSMEEADALCTRIAIMVKGSLLCIGSPQHLKTKFGAGYTLELKLKIRADDLQEDQQAYMLASTVAPTSENEVDFAFVKETFPECHLNESFGNRAIFSIPTSSVQSISKTFKLLEQLKEKGEIEEYSFSQTTLEQVFLGFAKDNEENEDE